MVVSSAQRMLTDRYRLEDPIATGGSGEVWRAADVLLGRAVAVKLLRPEHARDPEALARFRAEAQHAALVTHPGIVQVYDYGQAGPSGAPYLVMELVNGPSLAEALAGGPLDAAAVLDMITQVAAALASAHRAGLVHRDIKPANLLLARGGFVKITDFGIALAAGSASLTRAGTLPGTPGYLAPERAAGAPASAASDLYSLGIVAWECLAGEPPFAGTPLEVAFAHARDALPPLPPGVPSGLAALVAELTAKDPAARPASAAALAARASMLRSAMSGGAMWPTYSLAGSSAARSATLTLEGLKLDDRPTVHRAGRLWRWAQVAAAGAAAVVALTGGLAFALSGSAPQPHATAGQPTAAGSGTGAGAPAARMVLVDDAGLVGGPAGAALHQLRASGLRPKAVLVPDGRVDPGTVISVQPAGRVPAGGTVTVTIAMAPGHRHGHDGGDSGDGGSGGGSN